MKGFLRFLGGLLTVGMVLWDVVELLAIPALLVAVGVVQDFPWQYYVIMVGGYFLLFAVIELICYGIFRALERKYVPILVRKIQKYSSRFSEDT